MKLSKLFLAVVIVFCIVPFGLLPNTDRSNLIDYTFDLINDAVADSKKNSYQVKDATLMQLSKVFLESGDIDKILYIFSFLKLEDSKNKLMKIIFSSNLPFQSKIPDTFIPVIEQLDPSPDKIILFNELLLYSLRHKQLKTTKFCLNKLNGIYPLLESDDAIYFWLKSLEAVGPLMKHGLAKEASRILSDAEKFLINPGREIEFTFDFEIEQALIEQYISLRRSDDLKRVVQKYLNPTPPIIHSFEIAILLFQEGYIAEARSILSHHFQTLEKRTGEAPLDRYVYDFITDPTFFKSDILKNLFLRGDFTKTIVANIERNISYCFDNRRFSSKFEFNYVHMQYLKFLLHTGFFEIAEKVATKLDVTNNVNTFSILLKYNRLLEILPDFISVDTFNIACASASKRLHETISILPNEYKLHVYLKAAHICRKVEKTCLFLSMMNSAHQAVIAMKEEGYKYPRINLPSGTQCCLLWIESGYPEKAMDLIPYLSKWEPVDRIQYRVLQYYALHSDIHSAYRIFNLIRSDSRLKNLAASKIASRIYLSGKKEEGLKQFKDVIKSEITSNGIYLYEILKNYQGTWKVKVLRSYRWPST